MDLKAYFDHPKKGMKDELLDDVMADLRLVKKLAELAASHEAPYCWRACWVLTHTALKDPELVRPYVDKMIPYIISSPHIPHMGSGMRMISIVKPDVELHGDLLDFCLSALHRDDLRSHVQCYSLDTLGHFCREIPELSSEVSAVVEEALPKFEKKYLVTRARKLLKKLNQDT